ncbi:MAG: hypothetical protein Q4D80_04810 [Pseudomonadota bacterium]|nr:hypothetical protein [Pseudomonadota bacterium]
MTKFTKICILLLFLPIIILSVQMLRLSYMTTFSKVEIAVRGYDPKDFFSGYYMRLQPDWQNTDCAQFENKECPVKDFKKVYDFYIRLEHSSKLSSALLSNKNVVLEFSYKTGYEPIITDLKVDGVSYKNFITDKETLENSKK